MTRKILLITVMSIALLLIVSAIPINNDTVDVVVDTTIHNPFGSSPFIESYRTDIVPHTLFSLNSIAGLLYSDNLKLTLHSNSLSTTKDISKIWETSSGTYQIILRNVPKTTQTLTLDLYESGKKVSSKEIRL